MQHEASLLTGRLVIVTGKGGTGKTTVAATLARAAAARGQRVVLAEVGREEQATELLGKRLRNLAKPEDREMVLMAIGATDTKSALDALSKMDQRDRAVAAALREHRSSRAKDAAAKRR